MSKISSFGPNPFQRSLIVAAAAGFSALAGIAAARAQTCPAVPMPVPHLPHSRSVVAARRQFVIVALGSSSTEGAMASAPARSYPAELQADLSRLLASAHVAVINRGIGGQDVIEESARMDADVIPIHPQLVIWQVGANGALEDIAPDEFRRRVALGVHRLQLAGADVILMDNQRSPRLLAAHDSDALNRVLAEIAEDMDAGLFSRSHLMDRWRDEGAPYKLFIASDGMHQDDLGYACVAASLADVIAEAVVGPRQVARGEPSASVVPAR
jgi:lysophospholipase L1-like esterase